MKLGTVECAVVSRELQLEAIVEFNIAVEAAIHRKGGCGIVKFSSGEGRCIECHIAACEVEGTAFENAAVESDIAHLSEIKLGPFQIAAVESDILELGEMEISSAEIHIGKGDIREF